jgi:hypothetical protein
MVQLDRNDCSYATFAPRFVALFDCSLAVRLTHTCMYQDKHFDTPSTLVAKLAAKRRHDFQKPLKTLQDIMERSVGHDRGSSSYVMSPDLTVSRATEH